MSNTQASVEGSVSPSLTDSGNSNAAGASSQSNTTRVAAKRKTITPRSKVWSHFTKFVSSEGQSKGKCNYCDREFCCDGKKNGIGSLKYHMKQCKKSPTNVLGNNQCQLILPNKGLEGEVGQITTWKFDQEATRNALAQMIVIGEMSFKFVESEDPRQKLNYLEFALSEMYNSEKSSEVMQKVKDALFELFDEYKPPVSSACGQSSGGGNCFCK
ncbi:hypothetical protein V6N13_096832 [Hibiscus sabdariffa]